VRRVLCGRVGWEQADVGWARGAGRAGRLGAVGAG
jgi:hypothetical protein